MQKTKTDAIRVFQERVNRMTNNNQRELTLSAIEARNLSNELAQLTAMLLSLSSNENANTTMEVTVSGDKF
jgi:hypothetical protein